MELNQEAGAIGLTNLPNELISRILRNFCLHCRQGTTGTPQAYFPAKGQHEKEYSWYAVDVYALYAMCLVSRRFLPIAQEILFHEFAWSYGCSWNSSLHGLQCRLPAFLRTVAQNRNLADQVKRVYIDSIQIETRAPSMTDSVLEDAADARGIRLADFFQSCGDYLRPPMTRPAWVPWTVEMPLVMPSNPAVLGMLLACLPRLKTLIISSHFSLMTIPAAPLRDLGVSRIPIETLDLTCDFPYPSNTLDSALILASSTIRRLFLSGCRDDVLINLSNHPFPNLRNLCITQADVSHSGLEPFLSHCVGLETFSCESDDEFLSTDVVTHLVRNRDTLHTLHLKHYEEPHAPYGSTKSLTELKSNLNTFLALRNLFLTTTLLYHILDGSAEDDSILTQLLPPSLVSLQLAVDDVNPWVNVRLEIGIMAGLADSVSRGRFPNLRRVGCIPAERGGLCMRRLEAMFTAAGVEFGYDGWPFYDGVVGRRVDYQVNSPGRSAAATMDSDDEST